MSTMTDLPAPDDGILVTLFITVRDVARSRDFYSRVLGGTVALDENPCIVRLANSWIIMNPGGGPTPDKPGVSVVDYEPGDTTSIFLSTAARNCAATCATPTATSSRSASRPASCTASTPPGSPEASGRRSSGTGPRLPG
jgi:hypothetical protein